MDPSRRSLRNLDSKSHSDDTSSKDPLRASTIDSGRGSSVTSDRTPTSDRILTSAASSSISRDTPVDDGVAGLDLRLEQSGPLHIHRSRVLGNHCYEQAFVSYIDSPSAFFLQLAASRQQHEELEDEINEFYSNNPTRNTSTPWKQGDYCIAKYKKDNRYYRARIIATPQEHSTMNKFSVVYVDYGNWNDVDSTDIYPIQQKFTTLTAQAIPCSLHKSLPKNGRTWHDERTAMEFFENLVLEKYVDAIFHPKSPNNLWPLSFVELKLSSSNLNIRDRMKSEDLIREVSNEEIFREFYHLLKRVDYIIYNIPYEGEECDDDDDEDN